MESTGHDLVEAPISDEELTALALAADPDAPLPDDALPDALIHRDWALPMSYFPPASRSLRPPSRLRTVTAIVVIALFLAITAFGFCATYGPLQFA